MVHLQIGWVQGILKVQINEHLKYAAHKKLCGIPVVSYVSHSSDGESRPKILPLRVWGVTMCDHPFRQILWMWIPLPAAVYISRLEICLGWNKKWRQKTKQQQQKHTLLWWGKMQSQNIKKRSGDGLAEVLRKWCYCLHSGQDHPTSPNTFVCIMHGWKKNKHCEHMRYNIDI